MNRRDTLSMLLGQKSSSAAPPLLSGLEEYTGEWTFSQAAHLLRRTTFGPSCAEIDQAVSEGLEQSLERLFQDNPMPEDPINYYYEGDPNVAIGESWVSAPYIADAMVLNYRNRSLRAWQLKVMLEEPVSIREKMTLFWHNHFAVANINDAKFFHKHITLLRSYAIGNFRELVKEIIIDPAMLRFLNGNQNTQESPNENFARELLELFTIGKGPAAGPGDYTNYTEQDVREISRSLTGWRDAGYLNPIPGFEIGAFFRPVRHDGTSKQLSHRFNDVVITDGGNQEYKNVVDIIFQQDEVARFICRKLYRWFVYYEISDQVEMDVIQPMAQILIDNDYEIAPALRALLKSAHFFDALNIGPMIKNPYDFSLGLFKQNNIVLPTQETALYTFTALLFGFISLMEMRYFDPPSVAGWKAYYQEPAFYRIWINSSTLRPRMLLTDVFATTGFRSRNMDQIVIDVFEIVAALSQPEDPNALITELANLYYPQGINDEQLEALKEVLIPGLPNFEWTIEYNNYLENPDDAEIKASVEIKLRSLLKTMLNMPEFYLS